MLADGFAALGELTEEHFHKQLGVNVKGTLFKVQKALALMPNGSSIVLNGSMVSIKGVGAFGVYAATKAALRSFAPGRSTSRRVRSAWRY